MADPFFSQTVRTRKDGEDERVHVKIVDGTTSPAINQVKVDSNNNLYTSAIIRQNTDEEVISSFNAITSVVSGVNTVLLTYTVPVGKMAYLQKAELSGDNIASYEIYLDGVLSGRKRTYFGSSLNEEFNFEAENNKGLKLLANTVVVLKVTHNRLGLGSFDSRLQLVLTT